MSKIDVVLSILVSILILKDFGFFNLLFDFILKKTLSADKQADLEQDRNLFERKYYKELGTDEIVNVLKDWIELLIVPGKMERITTDFYNRNYTKIAIYGSATTIKILSIYTQYVYTEKKDQLIKVHESFSLYHLKMLYLLCLIICSLKKDFTNEIINPLTFIEIRLKDFILIKDKFKEVEKLYKEYLFS